MSAVAELAYDAERIAAIGHNGAPEPTSRETLATHLADLLVEAHAWADGSTVETQAQADEASRLIDDLNKAAKAADAQRVAEKAPHDQAVKEIQDFWNEWIAPATNKAPGRVPKAIAALKACVKPYLDRLEAERRAAVEKARQEAEAAATKAAEAHAAAAASDLAAQEAAEDLIAAAEQAAAAAKRIENSRTQARGGERAMGLRTVFVPVLTDRKAALLHYLVARPDDIVALLQRLAETDVREGKRSLPGFDVREETRL